MVSFNLLAAQVLFGVAALMWLRLVVTDRRALDLPAFAWPLAAYLRGLTSRARSSRSIRSPASIDLKQLVLFLMVPMVMRLARGERAMPRSTSSSPSAPPRRCSAWSSTRCSATTTSGNRPARLALALHDVLGRHHAGALRGRRPPALLPRTDRLASRRRAGPGSSRWTVTQTRNAWIGAALGIAVPARRQTPQAVVGWCRFVGPWCSSSPRRRRSRRGVSRSSTRTTRRIATVCRCSRWAPTWCATIRGSASAPKWSGDVYGHYLQPESRAYLQPASAQRADANCRRTRAAGPGRLAALRRRGRWSGLSRQLRRGPGAAHSPAQVSRRWSRWLAAGLFEYNFGDSEFLMLFLGLITLPFAAA